MTTDLGELGQALDVQFVARKRKVLVRELVEQERALAAIRARLAGSDASVAGGARGDNTERSAQITERGEAESLERQVGAHLRELESALARIDRGTYGICERCGQLIEAERLEALPEVALCAGCKSAGASLIQARSRVPIGA